MAALCRAVLGLSRPLVLQRIAADGALLQTFKAAARGRGQLLEFKASGAPFVPIASSWEEYLQSLSARRRQDYRRARRNLERAGKVEFEMRSPTAEEVDGFVNDPAPDAYPRLVDRLLASPLYGERWARHWLDVVRYADTCGYERDQEKPGAWRYRDWVVDAVNRDMSYDRFVTEQLAGDELPDRTDRSVIATGFIRLGTWNDEPNDPDEYKYERIEDMVNRTNQLNFTKSRVPEGSMRHHIVDPANYTVSVFVWDKYGFYGLVGFASVNRRRTLSHFLFSCRTMNMGIEEATAHFVSKTAPLDLPVRAERADWITVVSRDNPEFQSHIKKVETTPIRGRIMSSNSSRVTRTSVWSPGRLTAIVASVSDERASFARRHSSRSRAMAASVAGSSGSIVAPLERTVVITRLKSASSKSMPPRRSMPSGRPSCSKPSAVLRSIVASNVPPPKS